MKIPWWVGVICLVVGAVVASLFDHKTGSRLFDRAAKKRGEAEDETKRKLDALDDSAVVASLDEADKVRGVIDRGVRDAAGRGRSGDSGADGGKRGAADRARGFLDKMRHDRRGNVD